MEDRAILDIILTSIKLKTNQGNKRDKVTTAVDIKKQQNSLIKTKINQYYQYLNLNLVQKHTNNNKDIKRQ